MLESYLRNRLDEKDILLMTHIVLGYPSLADSLRIVEAMVEAGVDLMELQIPFSEPTADGPVIVRANQRALGAGTTVEDCLKLAETVAHTYAIPFLIMSYYNILFRYGVRRFVTAMAHDGLRGAIIPDLPPEEGGEYLDAMQAHNLAPILIFSPTTALARMRYIATFGRGFIYCVARKGVTGAHTDFSEDLAAYLRRCREATSLPLALGFGIKAKADIDFLKGKVDIAVLGSQTIRIMEAEGIGAVGDFIRRLR
ncbi:MAG: tryptophan synthase subunit alpha [Desulfobacterales bacterium]|nr:MAG: tryptophan synthase subunit alpha [Desulfobacterales bacterium]